jgi:obg-like ATPase 1
MSGLRRNKNQKQNEQHHSGAAKGEGLGNAFLSHISAVDGIFHVCRGFEDPDVTHVEDRIDPVSDLDIIHAELRAKDVERLDG